jgi:hypothetical protein
MQQLSPCLSFSFISKTFFFWHGLCFYSVEVKTMKNIILALLGLMILNACGDKKSVTTHPACSEHSYYDFDDKSWYMSLNDKTQCKSSVNNPDYNNGNFPEGTINKLYQPMTITQKKRKFSTWLNP